MPSSISNSNQRPGEAASAPAVSEQDKFFPHAGTAGQKRAVHIAIASLLAVLVLVMLSAELAARYLYPRISHIEARIVSDQRQVATLVGAAAEPPSVLIVGNSLLLHGLNYPQIQQEMAPDHVVRYVIENTDYLDWYYGLHRLFEEGVRPTRVVLMLNLGQELSHGILAESPNKLFLARHLLAVSRDAGLDTTQTSSVVFAHWSAFYAGREGIRNYILNISDPPYATELHRLARVPPKFPSDEEMLKQSRERLKNIDALCRKYGVQFTLVIPPALGGKNEILLQAGALEGVDVDAPIPMRSLGNEYFLDNFHLNEKGAALFTEALARDLRARLAAHSQNAE